MGMNLVINDLLYVNRLLGRIIKDESSSLTSEESESLRQAQSGLEDAIASVNMRVYT